MCVLVAVWSNSSLEKIKLCVHAVSVCFLLLVPPRWISACARPDHPIYLPHLDCVRHFSSSVVLFILLRYFVHLNINPNGNWLMNKKWGSSEKDFFRKQKLNSYFFPIRSLMICFKILQCCFIILLFIFQHELLYILLLL